MWGTIIFRLIILVTLFRIVRNVWPLFVVVRVLSLLESARINDTVLSDRMTSVVQTLVLRF